MSTGEHEAHSLRKGWSAALPEHIPAPTPWPPALALGVALSGWGLIASPVILAIGGVLFVVSLAGWIGDLRQ
jgi:hypothetical protein